MGLSTGILLILNKRFKTYCKRGEDTEECSLGCEGPLKAQQLGKPHLELGLSPSTQ